MSNAVLSSTGEEKEDRSIKSPTVSTRHNLRALTSMANKPLATPPLAGVQGSGSRQIIHRDPSSLMIGAGLRLMQLRNSCAVMVKKTDPCTYN
jgi:hypothetical protein